jgi:hypothetical protein
MRTYFIILLFLIVSKNGLSQNCSYAAADSSTYHLFINKEYSQLIKEGHKILKQGLDFYDLRMRMGIAKYNQGNYEQAFKHFKAAYKMNNADTVLLEYYYYSLKNTNRQDDAARLCKLFPTSLSKRMKITPFSTKNIIGNIEEITLTSGLSANNNIYVNQEKSFKDTADYSEVRLQGSTPLQSIYFKYKIMEGFKLHTGFTYFSNQSYGIAESNTETEKKLYRDNSWQYNLALDYRVKFGLKVGASFGLFNEKATFLTSTYDTIYWQYNYFDTLFKNKAYTGSIYLSQRFRNIELFTSFAIGSLGQQKQTQFDFGFIYYPFGNNKIYATSNLSLLKNDSARNFVLNQTIGSFLRKNTSFEVWGNYGNMQNLQRLGGFETYNMIDPILYSIGAKVAYTYQKITIIPSYTFGKRESTYNTYSLSNSTIHNNTYNNHNFKISLSWRLKN